MHEPRPADWPALDGPARKQAATNAHFATTLNRALELVPPERTRDLTLAAVEEIQRVTDGKRAAIAWSGGKDSLVLAALAATAGVDQGVLGMCHLEYPAMDAWCMANRPAGVTVIRTPQDLAWLAAHPNMLFPQTAALSGRWFQIVQHAAQDAYADQHRLDILLFGRRRQDGNFIGPEGQHRKEKTGVVSYCPIRDWTHAEVFAFLLRARTKLPPCYGWPNGFVVGTGPWAKRRRVSDEVDGWRQLVAIDPTILLNASPLFPLAAQVYQEWQQARYAQRGAR